MPEILLLTLEDAADGGCADGCGDGGCGGTPTRTPVLALREALRARGAELTEVTAVSDDEIDAALARLDGPARTDGLAWPAVEGPRLVVATAADGQLRAVLRRMVRRYAPPPRLRPDDLPADRTMPDLPPLGVLPLGPVPPTDLVSRLGLPTDPAAVAAAVLGDRTSRLDLLRTDAGSVTLHGALLGGVAEDGTAVPFRAGVQVDDATLATPDEALLACAVANADGYASVDGLPLAERADPADGVLDVAVLLAVRRRSGLRRKTAFEVRRARGRAVTVSPASEVHYADDGVMATLDRRRGWWVERDAWAVFTA